ncbi:hypothetical protein Vadar_024037 [Vaccinium darrowii]|uniref:Uncharacterized protein n=1 Tax=Vaccinium darrowii TaxID=229202 RepID=A0ACB7YPL4_9ERIC|nr:hypothetical protein Vadar_024037 [Vaccinium darrowii]
MPEPKKEKTHVTVKVQRQHAVDVFIRVRLDLPLRELKLAYCNRLGLDCDAVRFTYNGSRIHDHETVSDLKMEDGDVVDAWYDVLSG